MSTAGARYGAIAVAVGTFFAAAASCATTYAHVEFVEGNATIVDASSKQRPARVGEELLEGETLVTGSDGEIHARTTDSGLVALRPDSRVTVVFHRADGGDEDGTVLSLARGTLRAISGWIGRYRPQGYRIKANMATIGIRGTDHEPMVILQAGERGATLPGTYEKVNEGATFIENASGRLEVGAGKAAFAPRDGKAAPSELPKVPDFYRPTKNEERIRKRKEELAEQVEQSRLQRIEEVKERREKEEEHRRERRRKSTSK